MKTLLFLGSIGLPEIIIILIIILLLFGAKKIPELMRGMGKGVRNFKEGMKEVDNELNNIDKTTDNHSSSEDKTNNKQEEEAPK